MAAIAHAFQRHQRVHLGVVRCRLPRRPRHPESRAWASAIEVALNRRASREARLEAAQLAAQIAAEMRPVDHRLAVSLRPDSEGYEFWRNDFVQNVRRLLEND